ncbi:hypothetical protein D3C87_1749980 [compost metagenome]
MIVFLFAKLKLAPRFNDTKLFPSPLILEVKSNDLSFVLGAKNERLVRRLLVCSASTERLFFEVMSEFCSLNDISPIIGACVCLSISLRVVILSLSNSII